MADRNASGEAASGRSGDENQSSSPAMFALTIHSRIWGSGLRLLLLVAIFRVHVRVLVRVPIRVRVLFLGFGIASIHD